MLALTIFSGGTSEARLRLNEGTLGYSERPISTPSVAPIESLLETMKRSSVQSSTTFEGRSSTASQPKEGPPPSNLPFPRVQASSSTISSSITRQDSPKLPSRKAQQMSISAAVHHSGKKQQPEPKNPFEEEEDDTNNPFLEAEPRDSKNPFEEDDYDSSLNPFAE